LQTVTRTAQHLDIEALGIELEIGALESQPLLQHRQHDVERAHRHRLLGARHVEFGEFPHLAIVGFEEGAELVRYHHVDGHLLVARAQRVALDVPGGVVAGPRAQQFDMPRHRLERHDSAFIEHAITQEVPVLAHVGADIEHAVDVQAGQQLTQVERKVTLAHLAQRHDVVSE